MKKIILTAVIVSLGFFNLFAQRHSCSIEYIDGSEPTILYWEVTSQVMTIAGKSFTKHYFNFFESKYGGTSLLSLQVRDFYDRICFTPYYSKDFEEMDRCLYTGQFKLIDSGGDDPIRLSFYSDSDLEIQRYIDEDIWVIPHYPIMFKDKLGHVDFEVRTR